MISFEEARHIALAKIGEDRGLVEEMTREKDYGWYFYAQSKKWLETRDENGMLVGSSGFIVEREAGRIVQFGSVYGVDGNLQYYEAGLRHEFYVLTILQVFDVTQTLHALLHMRLIDARAEFDNDEFTVRPTQVGKTAFNTILSSLPYTFPIQHFYFFYPILFEMKRSNWLKFELLGFDREQVGDMPERAYNGFLPSYDPLNARRS
jgi:Immunity protein 35